MPKCAWCGRVFVDAAKLAKHHRGGCAAVEFEGVAALDAAATTDALLLKLDGGAAFSRGVGGSPPWVRTSPGRRRAARPRHARRRRGRDRALTVVGRVFSAPGAGSRGRARHGSSA